MQLTGTNSPRACPKVIGKRMIGVRENHQITLFSFESTNSQDKEREENRRKAKLFNRNYYLFTIISYLLSKQRKLRKELSGDDSKEDPPVPMPNTEVKLLNVDDTWRVTARESR